MQKDQKSCAVPVEKNTSGIDLTSPVLALQQEVNKAFAKFFGDTLPSLWHSSERMFNISPAIDVAETEKEIRITAELPGIDAKHVQVSLTDNSITIRGEKTEEKKEEKPGYSRRERSYGSFQRTLSLPDYINSDQAEASIDRGVLVVTVAKKEGAQHKTRTLEVKQAA
ncbi:MAG TPA: Hsp20/alpha crystallin family protein [Rickettsiales bacterium]|nr:Hsp20/alpha crystallin family protein [Rickettsiales bacterium]